MTPIKKLSKRLRKWKREWKRKRAEKREDERIERMVRALILRDLTVRKMRIVSKILGAAVAVATVNVVTCGICVFAEFGLINQNIAAYAVQAFFWGAVLFMALAIAAIIIDSTYEKLYRAIKRKKS